MPGPAPRPSAWHHHRWLALAAALLVLTVVAGAAAKVVQSHREQARTAQAAATSQLAAEIESRGLRMAVAATAARGLFAASKSVEAHEWAAFAAALREGHSLDATLGIAYVQRVPSGGMAAFVAEVRADGAPDFTAPAPVDGAAEAAIVRFLTCADGALPAIGADLAGTPPLAAAMARAAASGRLVSTAPLSAAGRDGAIVALCAPVYRNGVPVGDEAQRREACQGWILVPARAAALLAQARARVDLGPHVEQVALYDGNDARATATANGDEAADPAAAASAATAAFALADRQWSVATAMPLPSVAASLAAGAPQLLLAAILSALVAAVVLSLAWSSRRARALAAAMTKDLRESETRSAEAHARLQVFVDHAAAAVAMFDQDLRYVACSRRWLSDYGLGSQTIIGRSHYDVFPEIPERWKEIHRRCLAGAIESHTADPFDRADGRRQWLRWDVRPWRAADGSIGGVLMFTEDITASLEAARLREVTATVMEKVAADRPMAEILEGITTAAETMQQDLRASVLLLRDGRLHHGAAPSLPAEYATMVDGLAIGPDVGSCGTAAFLGQRVMTVDTATDPRWARFRDLAARFDLRACWSQPILAGSRDGAADHRVLGTFAMYFRTAREPSPQQIRLVEDLAHLAAVAIERCHAAEALRASLRDLTAARREAEAASLAKSEFLANMSHEIRTPMTAILGFADMLAGDAPDDLTPAQRREALAAIRHNGDHLLAIINDVLDISKIEAGMMRAERIPTDPRQVVDDVVALLRQRAETKGIALVVDHTNPLPGIVLGDPLRLRQVLVNLLGNAIKFTGKGRIEVATSCDRAGDAAGTWRVAITDTGIGMTAQQCAAAFQAFTQADSSTTRRFGGTGLGLRISKRLAELMGGDIALASAPGRGSTFTLTIPATPAGVDRATVPGAEAAAAAPVAGSPPTLKGTRILLAEDGRDNQRLVTMMLQRVGASVVVAENGNLAVGALCEGGDPARPLLSPCPFDLVLLDMQMPEMDGYAAAALLRQKGYDRALIALTAHALAGDRERCLAAGCDDYVRKPIDRAVLVDACWRAAAGVR